MKIVAVAVAVAVRGAKIAIKPLILGLALGLSATGPLLAQLHLHGDVNPLVRITRGQRVMDLPHRFVTIEGRRQGSSVGMFFATALEYRPGRDSLTLELREAYAEVYTGLGDWRFGKQIITWGAADGNNPTDNISPYDFYYLFLPGASRKMGTLAASANLYLGSLNLTAVMVPLFRPNRIPLNEPDFPIFGGSGNPFGNLPVGEIPVERELGNSEVALRIGLPLSRVDLSLSYFSGHDRMFTPIPWINPISSMMIPDSITLHYLSTQVIGGDLVTFIGGFAVRAEAAYFMTEDDEGILPFIRNPYWQYVLQLDYSGGQATYMAQYLGTYITKLDGDDIYYPLGTITEDDNERDNLPPKLGMPFAAIAQNAVMITASRDFSDGRYSVRGQTLYDLDHGGYMLGGQVTVGLEEAFDIEVGLTMLGGDEESRLYAMRDFSHLSLALKYSF